MTEPQEGATYDQLHDLVVEAERLGFNAFFRSDHYLRMAPGDPGPGPTDAWATLAGLARDTTTIRLGTMVSPATFRLPGPLAITVATVDAMSGGRVEMGLGAGWFEAEHTAYGIPFPALGERFDLLEEQLAIVTGLWGTPAGERFGFDGAHYRLADSPALPKPVQTPLPVVVGGQGRRRTPALAARFATEYNVGFDTEDAVSAAFDRGRAACESIGRDPATLVLSVALPLAVGCDDAVVRRRAEASGVDPAAPRAGVLLGSPAQVVDRIGSYAGLGATRVYLQVMDVTDLDHLRLAAAEMLPLI